MTEAENLGRFGHHPEAAIDFCVEVEEIEAIANNAKIGLTGFGHEQDRAGLDERIERALEFRVGADSNSVAAKDALRSLAQERGFDLTTEIAYAGQPCPRLTTTGAS